MNSQQALQALVIDDNEMNRMVARELLDSYGIASEDAEQGGEGLARLEEAEYDVVLLDINMPGISGDEVCKIIRARPAMRDTYVVAYTAHAFDSEKQRFLAAGFDALLVKPISLDSLGEALMPVLLRQPRAPRGYN